MNTLVVLSLSLAAHVLARPWEDGLDAWKRGEHLTFVQQDHTKAAAVWLRRAAEQGSAQAQGCTRQDVLRGRRRAAGLRGGIQVT